ncbi:MAG TPA: PH domain-containing protein [Gammaproteobacteria bacterium]
MAERSAAVAPPASGAWRRLSAWSIAHFAARAIVENLRAVAFAAPATYGVSQSAWQEHTWAVPAGIAAAVLIAGVLNYFFFFYRLRDDFVEVRRGVLFRKELNLSFARIQNIDIEQPFYFRPLRLVTLKIDSAGSKRDEVHLAALARPDAEALRRDILARKRALGGDERVLDDAASAPPRAADEVCCTRSLKDLVIHGLTNDRGWVAVAGVAGLISQVDLPVSPMLEAVGLEVDRLQVTSLFGMALLVVLLVVAAWASITLLSVAWAVVVYYGFTIRRSGDGLRVAHGLLTRREVQVPRSRIQVFAVKQDWLDYLIGRRNVVLEQVTHGRELEDGDWPGLRKKLVVPSLRIEETPPLLEEVFGVRRLDELPFTPLSKRYFYKHAKIWSCVYAAALVVPRAAVGAPWLYVPVVLVLWALHVALLYARWRRGGLAVDGDVVVTRSGAIGVDYQVFPAIKIQELRHVQSPLMRRNGVSTLVFRTAASRTRVPYLDAAFAKAVVDYCVYQVEATDRSWM